VGGAGPGGGPPGPAAAAAELDRLVALLGHDGDLRGLTEELARRIRDGSLDDRRPEIVGHIRESVRAKLTVANPRYLQS
jgi:hypothetical protein